MPGPVNVWLGGEDSPAAFISSVDQPFIKAERSLPFSAVVRYVAAGLRLLPSGYFLALILAYCFLSSGTLQSLK
jgi:hypothetical protein